MATFSRITEQQAYDEVVGTNRCFRNGELPREAYAFWDRHGVIVQSWVLASFALNDEGPCYCGDIIAPDGEAYFFQVDLSDEDRCVWERLSTRPRDTRAALNMAYVLRAELDRQG